VYALGVVLTPPVDTALGDELIYSLADPDGSVRLAAVRAVGRLHVTRAGDTLIGRIGDPELPVRLAAMRALGDLREARALVALQEQLDFYKSGSAGRAALDALARIAHPSSVGLFAEYRRSNNEDLRRYAYEGLGRLGNISDGDASVFESRLSEERHAEVIGAIAFALATTSRPHLDRIVEALPNPDTVDQAREYLVELGHVHPETLLPYLQNPNPDVREQIAMIVGVVGGTGAEAALTPLTTDTSEAVRRAAQVALTRLRAPAQRPEPR
jgi:HEAT repeat protein